MIVYDSEKHTLESFEPRGQLSPLEYNPTGLDMRLRKFVKQLDKMRHTYLHLRYVQ